MRWDNKRKFNPLSEVGTTGLTRFLGTVSEEFLRELQGSRGLKRYEEMARSPIGGALLRALSMVYRRVEWRVDPGGDTPQDEDAASFLESCIHDLNIPWVSFVCQAVWMLKAGHRWFEIVYKKRQGPGGDPASKYDEGRIGWRKFGDRPPETLGMGTGEWDFDEAGGLRGVWQVAPPGNKKVYIPIGKSLLFRTTDEKGNPEGESIFRPGWRSYYFVRELETVEAIVEERMGGVLVITLPDDPGTFSLDPDDSDSLYNQAKDVVVNFRADEQMGLVVPPRCKAELWSPGAGQREIGNTIQRHKRDFFMTCLCQSLMLGADRVGSWALSKDQSDFLLMALEGWLDNAKGVMNEIAVPRLFELNVFPKLTALPSLEHGKVGQRDVEVFFGALRDAVESGLVVPGREDEEEARRVLGLPALPEEKEAGSKVDLSRMGHSTERFQAGPERGGPPDEGGMTDAAGRALSERRARLEEELRKRQKVPGEKYWEEEKRTLKQAILPEMEHYALLGAERAVEALGPGIGVDWTLVNQAASDWARRYTFDLVTKLTDTSRKALQTQISTWIESGEPLPDLIGRLESIYGPVRASMIGVTESTRVFSEGHILAFRESGVVEGYKVNGAEDELVCPVCREVIAGGPYPLDDTEHRPPLHVNCRCWVVPVVMKAK